MSLRKRYVKSKLANVGCIVYLYKKRDTLFWCFNKVVYKYQKLHIFAFLLIKSWCEIAIKLREQSFFMFIKSVKQYRKYYTNVTVYMIWHIISTIVNIFLDKQRIRKKQKEGILIILHVWLFEFDYSVFKNLDDVKWGIFVCATRYHWKWWNGKIPFELHFISNNAIGRIDLLIEF